MNQPRSYYWDSSVFITVLQKSMAYGSDTLGAASEILQRASSGQAIIVSSTILVAEILPFHCTTEQYDQFEALLQSPYIVLRAVDVAVARKAVELREKCQRHQKKLRLETPDALHIATYLLYENKIDQIHSYDPHFPSKFNWLDLAGSPCHPFRDQTAMDFVIDQDESDIETASLLPDEAIENKIDPTATETMNDES